MVQLIGLFGSIQEHGNEVTGELIVSGTVRSTGMTHITHHCYSNTGTAAVHIPFVTEVESTGGDRRNHMIAPLPGRLLKVWVRSKNAQNGSVVVSLVKAGDGTEDFAGGAGTEVENVTATMTNANTSYAFSFTGSNPQYSAGEIIGVKVNPAANGGDYNVTCIWEYNTSVL